MKAKVEDSAVANNVASARAAYETAVADVAIGSKRCAESAEVVAKVHAAIESVTFAPGNVELSRALRQGEYVKRSYPLEAERLKFLIDTREAEDRKRLASFDWGGASLCDAVQRGDRNAVNIATLADDLCALSARDESFANELAAKARIDSSRKAVAAREAECAAAHEPPPPSINGHALWRALRATARAKSAGVSMTPAEVLRAGRGYADPSDGNVASVDEALDRFLRPQAPKKSSGKLEALRRELAALNAHAYAMREQELATLAQVEEAERIRKEDREEAKKREARDAEARAKQGAKADAIARERQAKIAEFAADAMRRTVAEP